MKTLIDNDDDDNVGTMHTTSTSISVPTIDLSQPDDVLIPLIAHACSEFGFFQILHHELDTQAYFRAMEDYFKLPKKEKLSYKRHSQNARGYFDDELTKQRRDWKECLDVGTPGSRDWDLPDDDARNACLDGYNVFPSLQLLPNFRSTVTNYFDQCAHLSHRLAILMAKGLNKQEVDETFLDELKQSHASYLRLNYYPLCLEADTSILGVSPHRDAGFLTILLQDESCHSLQALYKNEWITIHPAPHALTINTGDMCMLWSNGVYQAPLHRVLTSDSRERYSSPFFYNPGYHQWIKPSTTQQQQQDEDERNYHDCLYGYFRAVRFAGDLTNWGVAEIQTDDYRVLTNADDTKKSSHHVENQTLFAQQANFRQPFSVETYRSLLLNNSSNPDEEKEA